MGALKYAIIGSGTMGREHIRNINLLKNAEVVALCDNHKASIDESRKDLINNPRIFSHHNELIEAKIADVYIIATPNFSHIDILKDIIKTKAHLLIEKPLCTNVRDCLNFKKITKGYPGIIWTAMEYRYMPPVAKFIKEIKSGTIGDLKMFSIREHRFPFLVKVNDWNRFSKNTGGTLVEKCCHFFDLMRLITKSEPKRIMASAGQNVNHLDEIYDGKTPDILDNGYVLVDFENGIRAMLELCMFAEGSKYQEEIIAVGPKGKLETKIPGPARFWSKKLGDPPVPLVIQSPRYPMDPKVTEVTVDPVLLEAGDHNGSTYYQHKRFLDLVLGKIQKPDVTLEDGYKAVIMGMAAQESAKEGRAVEFD